MNESNFLIPVVTRVAVTGVSIWYLAWPVALPTRVIRRGEFRANRSVQPLITVQMELAKMEYWLCMRDQELDPSHPVQHECTWMG